jgi:hypothetical protein
VLSFLHVPQLFTGELIWDERFSEYIPWRIEAARSWAEGEFPWFTDRVFGGMPLFATAYGGVLYPPNLLYLSGDPRIANLLEWFHLLLGTLGLWTYLRLRGLVALPCFVGALLFQYSAFPLFHGSHVSMREAALLAPWVASAGWWMLRSPSSRRAATLALVLALQIAAGYLQLVLMTLCWVALDACWWLVPRARWLRGAVPRVGFLSAGIACGVLLLAVQIIVTLKFTPETPRAGLTLESWQAESLPPNRLSILASPLRFGPPWGDPAGEGISPEMHAAAPPLAWLLALLALVHAAFVGRNRRTVLISGLGILLSIALALGSWLPANAFLFHVPPFNLFRVPSRWLFLASALACVLAAYAVQGALHSTTTRRPGASILALGVTLFLAVVLAFGFDQLPGGALPSWFRMSQAELFLPLAGVLRGPWLLLASPWAHLILLLLSFMALALGGRLLSRRLVLIPATFLIVLAAFLPWATLRSAGVSYPTRLDWVFDLRQNVVLKDYNPKQIQRFFAFSTTGDKTADPFLPHGSFLFPGLRGLGGYCPIYSRTVLEGLAISQSGGTWREFDYYRNPTSLAVVGVSHLFVPLGAMDPERRAAAEAFLRDHADSLVVAEGLHLTQLRQVLPRFDLRTDWLPAPTQSAAFERNWQTPFDELASRPIMLEGPPPLNPAREGPPAGSIEVRRSHGSRQTVRVDLKEPAVLVIRDIWWPGWEWRIRGTGEHGKVERAEGLVRWVPLRAGAYTLELRYVAPGQRTGLALSALGAVGIALLLLAPFLRNRVGRGFALPR